MFVTSLGVRAGNACRGSSMASSISARCTSILLRRMMGATSVGRSSALVRVDEVGRAEGLGEPRSLSSGAAMPPFLSAGSSGRRGAWPPVDWCKASSVDSGGWGLTAVSCPTCEVSGLSGWCLASSAAGPAASCFVATGVWPVSAAADDTAAASSTSEISNSTMNSCAATVTGLPVFAGCGSCFALTGFGVPRFLFVEADAEGSAAGSFLTRASLAAAFARGLGGVLVALAALLPPP